MVQSTTDAERSDGEESDNMVQSTTDAERSDGEESDNRDLSRPG